MKTIERHQQIHDLLCFIDARATAALNKGLKYTVEDKTNGITESQFKAMHVWCGMCADYLNTIKVYRCSPVTGRPMPWTKDSFKEIYKILLATWKGKASTKDQDTIEPSEIVLALSGHLATAHKRNITLPEWPQLRG